MSTYKIHVDQADDYSFTHKYHAYFDGYDGSPIDDETPSQDKLGRGETELEAIKE